VDEIGLEAPTRLPMRGINLARNELEVGPAVEPLLDLDDGKAEGADRRLCVLSYALEFTDTKADGLKNRPFNWLRKRAYPTKFHNSL
jgi:hypothetical protein